MSWLRPLGSTGIQVSALGLGTVKLGRNQGLKYPTGSTLPDDASATKLLDRARALGINLLDTAPAYGSSEERLGGLLAGQRQHWVICSKVGEEFEQGQSRFDFSPEHARASVLRSLRRLRTDFLDIVLVHSAGNDLQIIEQMGTLEALAQLKSEGLLRAFGISTKTVAGGLAAAQVCDVVMLTYNLQQREELAVLDACQRLRRGALVKKALGSGQLPPDAGLGLVFSHAGTSAAVVGTLNPAHLQADVEAARRVLRS
jgi:aryl-alcohol dehydrogenase-like predicted oxidoreductase